MPQSLSFSRGVAYAAMSRSMTVGTQRNQVVQLIVSERAAKLNVVNFQLRRASTLLTSPAISFENLSVKRSVGIWSQLQSRTPWPD